MSNLEPEKKTEQAATPETTVVHTVDNRTSAGHDEPKKEPTGIVHQKHDDPSGKEGGDSGGMLSSAAEAVKSTVKSAKDAVSGGAAKDQTTAKE